MICSQIFFLSFLFEQKTAYDVRISDWSSDVCSSDLLPSTTHRVRNPDAGRAVVARYSMPFFLHLRSDYVIRTLESCIDAAHPDLYPEPITADEYLQERLREIGLKA